jgi:uncharacterized membrane protein
MPTNCKLLSGSFRTPNRAFSFEHTPPIFLLQLHIHSRNTRRDLRSLTLTTAAFFLPTFGLSIRVTFIPSTAYGLTAPMGSLKPPFEEQKSLFSIPTSINQALSSRTSLNLSIPAAYHAREGGRRVLQTIEEEDDVLSWIQHDLDVFRLNQIHKHLWMAGLPQICRGLHEQVMIGREIVITERADLHLVWHDNIIFIKPLPDYLLNYEVWESALCLDSGLFQDAKGFLLSYIWLICHKSDWKLAQDKDLFSKDISWERWIDFSRAVLTNINHGSLQDVNPRYLYGELRLRRLDLIYRFCSKTWKLTTLIRGYHYGYHQYSTFVQRNFAWVLTAIIYITIVLTAMQVGLATTQLKDNRAFNRSAYGFTVFSILAPLIVLVIVAAILSLIFCMNWFYTRKKKQKAAQQYPFLNNNPRTDHKRHC